MFSVKDIFHYSSQHSELGKNCVYVLRIYNLFYMLRIKSNKIYAYFCFLDIQRVYQNKLQSFLSKHTIIAKLGFKIALEYSIDVHVTLKYKNFLTIKLPLKIPVNDFILCIVQLLTDRGIY